MVAILRKKRNKAFTLIELLVVIAIIALLLSIMMPALRKVKEQARKVVCASNLSQTGKALEAYEVTYDYKLFVLRGDATELNGFWWGKLAPFFGNDHYENDIATGKVIDVLICPSAPVSKFDRSTAEQAQSVGYWGTASAPWEWIRTDGVSTLGSYTINSWIGYDYLYDQAPGREPYMFRNWLDVSPGVPAIGCGRWVNSYPKATDSPPSNLQGEAGASTNGTSRFCIARHSRSVNFVFKDLHVDPTQQLEDLWQYRWHKNYAPPTTRVQLPR